MRPIQVVIAVHIEPMGPGPDSRRKREDYARRRAELLWLHETAKRFGAKLSVQANGEYVEYCRELGHQEDFLSLLRDGHDVGTHAHPVYREGPHQWVRVPPRAAHSGMAERIWADNVAAVETVIGREANTVMCAAVPQSGTQQHTQLMKQFAFSIQGGGPNEEAYAFWGHDVWNPWRPGLGPTGVEDLGQRDFILVPHLPQIGRTNPHGPLRIPQDRRLASLQRQFLQEYLNWRALERQGGSPRVWTFGCATHPEQNPQHRDDIVRFLEWLNANFIGRRSAGGNVIAEYASFGEVAKGFADFERQAPDRSSLSMPRARAYPYPLLGLLEPLKKALYVGRIAGAENEAEAHVLRIGEKQAALAWREMGTALLEVSDVVGAEVEVIAAASGERRQADGRAVEVSGDPVLIIAR